MPRIEYFLSTISPYTYLAGQRLEQIAARHGAQIDYKPLDMLALFPRMGGAVLEDRHIARREYRLQELRRQAAKAEVPINLSPAFFPVNAAPSSYAVIAAQRAGGGDLGALVAGFTRACWAEERDISSDAVVRDCLAAAGFDAGLADRGMLASAETYAANLEDATRRGVFGVPFYITGNDERFWGQDRLADLEGYLAG